MWKGVSLSLLALGLALLAAPAAGADDGDEAKAAVAAFRKRMHDGSERDRIRAVNEPASFEGKGISREPCKVVGSDRSERVRAAAGQALGRRGERRDLAFLVASVRRLKPSRRRVEVGQASGEKELLARFQKVSEQTRDEAVKLDGVDAVRQTIEGRAGENGLKIQRTVVVREGTMYVIRVTADGWADRAAVEEAKGFHGSFRFQG